MFQPHGDSTQSLNDILKWPQNHHDLSQSSQRMKLREARTPLSTYTYCSNRLVNPKVVLHQTLTLDANTGDETVLRGIHLLM